MTANRRTFPERQVKRPETDDASLAPEVQSAIAEAVSGIVYGAVEVLIHNGKVVQIEARRKLRFDEPASR